MAGPIRPRDEGAELELDVVRRAPGRSTTGQRRRLAPVALSVGIVAVVAVVIGLNLSPGAGSAALPASATQPPPTASPTLEPQDAPNPAGPSRAGGADEPVPSWKLPIPTPDRTASPEVRLTVSTYLHDNAAAYAAAATTIAADAQAKDGAAISAASATLAVRAAANGDWIH